MTNRGPLGATPTNHRGSGTRPLPVPFVDLAAAHRPLRAEIDEAIARVIDASAFVGGAEVKDFEQAYAAYLGVEHVIGVASGLSLR